jgi:hypothetical protein
VGGVGGLPLGGERVLHVGQAQLRLFDLLAVHGQVRDLGEGEVDRVGCWVDAGDLCGAAVAKLAVFAVVQGAADLDLVAVVQVVGAAGCRYRVVAEFVVLMADGLGAGVEVVEVLVGGLRDHDRCPPGLAVGVCGVQRGVLGAGEIRVEVDPVTGGVSANGGLVLAVTE